jgi:HlyD family secretion protein
VVLIGVTAVAVVAFGFILQSSAAPPPTPQPAMPPIVSLTAHGEIKPADRATLRTLNGGRIAQLPVDLGQSVEPEQAVVRVNGPNGLEIITAPLRGTLTSLAVHTGDTVTPGSVVATVGDLSRLQVETTDVDEYLISRIQPGQSASLRLDALDGRTFSGRVRLVAPQPETTTTGDRQYPVAIDFGGPVAGPRAGMTVRVTFAE